MKVLPSVEGAFSFVLLDADRLIGVRDPNGFRPLCLGRLDATDEFEKGWVLASESPALDVIGATFIRELEPGEMVVIDGKEVRSERPFPVERLNPKLCIFEFVYFARPDTTPLRATRCTAPAAGWASCWPPRRRSPPTW